MYLAIYIHINIYINKI